MYVSILVGIVIKYFTRYYCSDLCTNFFISIYTHTFLTYIFTLFQIDIKVDPTIPLTDDLLLQAADSLDLFASQFIKDTVKRNVIYSSKLGI